MDIAQNDSDVNALLDVVSEKIDRGETKYRGMSYEEGICAAIMWLTNADYDHPYTEDEEYEDGDTEDEEDEEVSD